MEMWYSVEQNYTAKRALLTNVRMSEKIHVHFLKVLCPDWIYSTLDSKDETDEIRHSS